eukprot:TRINITY_DN2592_c0_g4_i1.p1 TRINITY_DN2592_c0_g4~~TRINITY_DN2592_c0_g4_i1.p1  ORF type:complete len:323 (+),score=40.53 TRINITY_DN2592_c0_g4_i1:110-970(+)
MYDKTVNIVCILILVFELVVVYGQLPPTTFVAPTPNTTSPTIPTIPTPPPTPSGNSTIDNMCRTIDKKIRYVGAVAVIIIGLAFATCGYRIQKIVCFSLGFMIAFGIAWILLQTHLNEKLSVWVRLGISAGAGVIAGALLLWLIKVGIFMLGFGMGVVICSLVLATPIGTNVIHCCSGGNWYPIIIMFLCGVAGGIFAIMVERWVIMFLTAIGGAYAIVFAIDCAWLKSNFSDVIPAVISLRHLNIDPHKPLPYVLLCLVGVLGVIGFFIQLCHRRRSKKDRGSIN